MLRKINREDWVKISPKINPTKLESEDILGVPAFEINEIFIQLCKRILSGPVLEENFGNEKKKEHFVAMEGPKSTRPQGGRVSVTELKIPDILRPYQKDNLIPKRSVGTLTRNVVKFGKK